MREGGKEGFAQQEIEGISRRGAESVKEAREFKVSFSFGS